AVEHLRDEDEVSTRLRHLVPLVPDERSVAVGMSEGLARDSRGVRCREFVVREDEVVPATLHGEQLAESLACNHRALDVPPRPPCADSALPARLALASSAPQQWIDRRALALSVGVAPPFSAQCLHE